MVSNLMYFSAIFVAALVAGLLFPPSLYESGSSVFGGFVLGDPVITVFWIFVFNLVVSAFIVVTLSGLVFFPLSAVALLVRAVLWGLLFYPLPVWTFLAVLPTLVLEGEAYVFAAVAGTTLGMSWLKPPWTYHEESRLSRWSALKRAYGEFKHVYFVVAVLLFVAAIAETLTIAYL